VRVLVQYPLYQAGEVGWLGTSKIVLGWPLQVATFVGMAALLARGRTPAR
jgi:predicted membrane-bound mannosyltransferase